MERITLGSGIFYSKKYTLWNISFTDKRLQEGEESAETKS